MIPVRLQLRNFLSYGADAPVLYFDGFKLACLAGDNGHGKSSLLDAITWALWGKARASDEELVHQGCREMEVDFEFLLGETTYRVVRKYDRERRARSTVGTHLELQIGAGGEYRSIRENTVRDTERKIVELLRMSYETFVNSAFLRQGRADEFTIKSPAERKRVLADILGLAFYEDLEKRARELSRRHEARARELNAVIEQIDREIEDQPRLEAERARIEGEMQVLQLAAERAQAAYQAARDRQQLAAERRRRQVELQHDLADAERICRQAEREVEQCRSRVERAEAILAQHAEIMAGYQQLLAVRERSEQLGILAHRHAALSERARSLQQAVDAAKHELLSERQAQVAQLEMYRQRIAEIPVLRERLVACQRERAALVHEIQPRIEQLRRQQEQLIEDVQHLRSENNRLQGEMKVLADRVNQLAGEGAACPLCGTELGVEGRRRLRETLRDEGRSRKQQYQENEARIRVLGEERTACQRQLDQLEQRLAQETRRLDSLVGSLEQRLREAERAEADVARLASAVDAIDRRLSAGDFARSEQAELDAVKAEIASLRYDGEEHRRVLDDLQRLAEFEERHRQLEAAAASAAAEREALRRAELLASDRRARLAELRDRFAALAAEVTALGDVDAAVDQADAALRQAAARLQEQRDRLARLHQQLESCARLAATRAERVAEQQAARREKAICDELAVAFGKKGVQAMLIETALPEIEREANAILARMTDNRLYVKLETQRDSKKGDTIETLDILISDELGTRSYESFSGGEAFRVNFAIRIALSKLLARRAGAPLQTLIIDEGFGTQDAKGREKLIEAITAIQEDFEKILVITHLDELKDHFPVRIEVTKTPTGSTFVVI